MSEYEKGYLAGLRFAKDQCARRADPLREVQIEVLGEMERVLNAIDLRSAGAPS